ncbi:MAG TPA: SGNH/GDSL hydrolase family protein [Acetobacteraceae bacterium]|nr:SGNH/GDSL hydrolase family protein [Acetobacteraceae bacterium]
MWRRVGSRGLAGLALLAVLAMPAFAAGDPSCPPGPAQPPFHLPHLQAALAAQTEGVIVALGSSSTFGTKASDDAHSYPAVLQAALGHVLPTAHVAVLNRGIGGQDAREELKRLQTDAIAVRPQLVIWQIGANGAMRNADPAIFHSYLAEGVAQLQAAGIDVILMDNQRAPRIVTSPDHVALEAQIADVARESAANLFSRGRLMDSWQAHGAPAAQFIADDGLHHNDRGYFCVASALATQIVAALRAPVTVSASR